MASVSSVSYKFNINGEHTKFLQAHRGIRQGDPISPMLFVIIMEYMNRLMFKMQARPEFHHHAQCKKLSLTNLIFADDVLLFCRGDSRSVELMKGAFNTFTNSTGLRANASKSRMYFGGINDDLKHELLSMTGFTEGALPVRYLGVPLTSRRLNVHHYMPLIEKIAGRMHHWTTKLLSYAGRIQLVKSITRAVAQFWMQCFPIPKGVIKKIEDICRKFIWTGNHENNSSKSPVAWIKVCSSYKQGGLQILNMYWWNCALLMKCLWNISEKADNLWVKWINCHYLKGRDVMEYEIKGSNSWMFKGILKQREHIANMQQVWNEAKLKHKFSTTKFYKCLIDDGSSVDWANVMQSNKAQPRALICLWMACHMHLPTRDRLKRFGILQDSNCVLCNESEESHNHIFFQCRKTGNIWKNILEWIELKHQPVRWEDEIRWISTIAKGKGWKAMLIKVCIAETIYSVWRMRNDACFKNNVDNTNIVEKN
ncbi:uncharacterized protein LOC131658182 [Vicia villosa]|uniref:uncharacterized protein LOC131658182 n=1 Tax=Vicia villosa TaxID=3911 RepID=UPI00273B9F9E|nr:uncharacterized protein LOC131658182 [Vicia villosa]